MIDRDAVRPGVLVWYAVRPGTEFPAVVDGLPTLLGGSTWAVRLCDLPEAYARQTCRGANWCPAAALSSLRVRELEHTCGISDYCAHPECELGRSDQPRWTLTAVAPPQIGERHDPRRGGAEHF